MNRIWCVLAVTTACAAPTEHTAGPASAVPNCPDPSCPACPDRRCPPNACPICLEPPSRPPSPKARDWYCHAYRKNRGEPTSICWLSKEICQRKRKELYRRRLGTTKRCVPERIAYCVQVIGASSMSRQTFCQQTRKDCLILLKDIPKSLRIDHVSDCVPMLNVDRYDPPATFPPPEAVPDPG